MDLDKIKEVVEYILSKKELGEIEIEDNGTRIYVNRNNIPNVINHSKENIEKNYILKSPMVGIFYRKPNPEANNFVEEGSNIKKGDTLCVLESMKIFNNLDSEVSGEIINIFIEDGSPVEYDQPLFEIKIT